jgi:hypothetical protein
VSRFSVTVKPFPVLPCLGISAVLLGLFKCQAPQHSSVGPVDVWSVETNNVVGHWYVRTRWDEGARRPRIGQSTPAVRQLRGSALQNAIDSLTSATTGASNACQRAALNLRSKVRFKKRTGLDTGRNVIPLTAKSSRW